MNSELSSYHFQPVAVVRSCFKTKFGIPRQPGLISEARGSIELLPPYNQPNAVRGLEGIKEATLNIGGMDVTVAVASGTGNATKLLERAIERNVAFVPGAPFYAGQGKPNTLRLSFVTVSEARIREGIAILGELIRAS